MSDPHDLPDLVVPSAPEPIVRLDETEPEPGPLPSITTKPPDAILTLDEEPRADALVDLPKHCVPPPPSLRLPDEPTLIAWDAAVRVDGVRVHAVLRPDLDHTGWHGHDAPQDVVSTALTLGSLQITWPLPTAPSPSAVLLIGRDVLSGRVDIRC